MWQPAIRASSGGPFVSHSYRRGRRKILLQQLRTKRCRIPWSVLSESSLRLYLLCSLHSCPLQLPPLLHWRYYLLYACLEPISTKDSAMTTNQPASSPSGQINGVIDGQRDPHSLRAISPDRVSALSNESATSIDNLAGQRGSLGKSHPNLSWMTAVIPRVFQRPRPSRTSSAFARWKGKQRRPLPKMLSYAITATIAVMSVVFAPVQKAALLIFMSSVLASLLVYYIVHLRSLIPPSDIQKTIASWGLANYPTQSVPKLPADFSRDIATIPCHSHNDYWRHVPLYDALAAGCTSVEADVWLIGNDLFVGHSRKSLTKERTLQSLYIDPIVSILTIQNTASQATTTNHTLSSVTSPDTSNRTGVFDTSPTTPLTLLIDMKTNGALTFPVVLEHLEPFRSRGWLTHFDGSAVVPGLITVVGTGNTPFDLLVANTTYRDMFYDAPLDELWGDSPTPINDYDNLLIGTKYTAENSYYASVSFQEEIGSLWHGMLTPQQVLKIRGQVKGAEERGLKARYWDTPGWPVGRRDHVWDVLVREGVGSLNVDDLEAAKERNWGG